MASLIENNLTLIFFILLGIFAVLMIVVMFLYIRLRRLEMETGYLNRGMEGKSFSEIVSKNIHETERLMEAVKALAKRYDFVLRRLAGTLQHVGVVRFDAFRELGGRLSFSIALLDDRGNGLVMSSIYGRSESRTYAKPVVEGKSSYDLSPEEYEAIYRALQSKDQGALPMEAEDLVHEERIATLKLFHEKEIEVPPVGGRAVQSARKGPRVAGRGRVDERRARRLDGKKPAGRVPEDREVGGGRGSWRKAAVKGEKKEKVSLREYVEGIAQRSPGKDNDRLRLATRREAKVVSGEEIGEVARVKERKLRPKEKEPGGEARMKRSGKGKNPSLPGEGVPPESRLTGEQKSPSGESSRGD